MSYIRPLEGEAGLYIYGGEDGVEFCCFPDHSGEIFEDQMLDIFLYLIDEEEFKSRQEHGKQLFDLLCKQDKFGFENNRKYWEWLENGRKLKEN